MQTHIEDTIRDEKGEPIVIPVDPATEGICLGCE